MDELSDAQVRELRAALVGLQQELTALVASSQHGGKTVELDQASVGRLSRMDAMQQQQMAQASQRAALQRLQQVTVAFDRMDEEEYGLCALCEEPIGYPRLKARPEAPFCLACQKRTER